MTLTLALRTQPPARVRAPALVPDRLHGLSASEVAALSVRCGRRSLAVGDLFDLSGAGGEDLVLTGDLRRVDEIATGMTRGRVVVEGPCGDHVGARMSGGEIEVRGDAGAWAGAELAGGLLRIRGDAGARLGAAYPGARAGMTAGEIVVSGDAGEEVGAGLRRGLVAVGGQAASGAGLRMLAGTVIALGGIGREAGIGNKRGSLVSGRTVEPVPVYAFAARYQPPALRLQLRRVRELGLTVDDALVRGTWARWSGDRTELSRGEILIFDEEEPG
ncbi:MAG TPA: formylmethanofuran dehydrogenase subunit C [Solirubrobacteraceae bacterium]|nr:formylmethanofuran dehydrogenase subunit C [Solirubrobacteraceae bacterium]